MAESIISNVLNKAVDTVLSQFTQKTLNASEYITINSGFTVNGLYVWQIAPHIAFVHYDIAGTINKGQTVVGAGTNKIKSTAYGASRVSNATLGTIPATSVVFDGAFRIHSMETGFASAGTLIIII